MNKIKKILAVFLVFCLVTMFAVSCSQSQSCIDCDKQTAEVSLVGTDSSKDHLSSNNDNVGNQSNTESDNDELDMDETADSSNEQIGNETSETTEETADEASEELEETDAIYLFTTGNKRLSSEINIEVGQTFKFYCYLPIFDEKKTAHIRMKSNNRSVVEEEMPSYIYEWSPNRTKHGSKANQELAFTGKSQGSVKIELYTDIDDVKEVFRTISVNVIDPYEENLYPKRYVSFTSPNEFTISYNRDGSYSGNEMQYCKDGKWYLMNAYEAYSAVETSSGIYELRIRGQHNKSLGGAKFAINGSDVSMKGNISDLINYTNRVLFADAKFYEKTNIFSNVFSGCDALTDLSELNLDLSNAPEMCYNSTFENCKNLKYAPKSCGVVSAGKYAFASTFRGCTNLVSTPFFGIIESADDGAFFNTFANCTSLKRPNPVSLKVDFSGYKCVFDRTFENSGVKLTKTQTPNPVVYVPANQSKIAYSLAEDCGYQSSGMYYAI